MMRLIRSAAVVAILAGAISLPAAAQVPANGIGGIGRRGRYIVSGTVREAEGERPLENIEVQLWATSAGVVASTFTNSNGSFAFADVRDGSYRLVVEEQGYAKIQEEVNFTSRPPVGIQLLLKREVLFPPVKIGDGPTVSTRQLSIPRRAREAMERGLSLMNEKSDYKGSLKQFQRAVREYSGYYEAYLQMGLAYMQMGDTAKAEETLIASIRVSDRQYPDALFRLASLYSLQEHFADAEPLAREAVELDPNSPEAYQELARALHGLDQSAAAEASAREALRLQPDNPQTHLILANIHLKMGNFMALLEDLDTYLQISPDGPDADQARQMREQIFERMANIQPRTP
jgi:Flp pilus assembly protein TadD